ncbi:hypothetical protein [Pseudovibrio exalbescens]|uniref:hypothetical protein n=1 Tax=Pseudovibrio exalbescens TaxID=197461 RepID=UPI000C9CF683|nr:hypothetical protein [Pseudovibrio exalbescens]
MPDLIRHPEQHGTEDAAAALLDPGSKAGVTEVGWTIGLWASLMTAGKCFAMIPSHRIIADVIPDQRSADPRSSTVRAGANTSHLMSCRT